MQPGRDPEAAARRNVGDGSRTGATQATHFDSQAQDRRRRRENHTPRCGPVPTDEDHHTVTMLSKDVPTRSWSRRTHQCPCAQNIALPAPVASDQKPGKWRRPADSRRHSRRRPNDPRSGAADRSAASTSDASRRAAAGARYVHLGTARETSTRGGGQLATRQRAESRNNYAHMTLPGLFLSS